MMNKLRQVLGFFSLLALSLVNATELEFAPTNITANIGDSVVIDIVATPQAGELIGAYDFIVNFDPTILALSDVTFGSSLNDDPVLCNLSACRGFLDLGGGIEMFEAASPFTPLGNLQDGVSPVILATLSFDVIGEGTAQLSFTGNILGQSAPFNLLGDEFGIPLPVFNPGIAEITVSNVVGPDVDGDGIPDVDDNCPTVGNPLQENFDGDGEGDTCDLDDDNDGQTDEDEIACGSDPLNAASLSADNDSDDVPDCVDPDDDNDEVVDGEDAFPFDPTESSDNDGDGIGDNADTDDDNDSQTDADETACGSDPLSASSKAPDADNDSIPDCVDPDDDNDGVADGDDACSDTSEEAPLSSRGLGKNRWALLNGENFVQAAPQEGSVFSFSTTETRGCSCSQIVEVAGLGNNHLQRGCSTSAMLDWTNSP